MDSIYSLAFYLTFSLALFFGLYILIQDPKEKINRLFFVMTLVLCFWAFGFSLSIIAEKVELALFWRRISAVGRTMIHAFLLHTIVILTGNDKKLNYTKTILLYLPGLVSLYIFALSNAMASKQYDLIMSSIGWQNNASENIYSILFHIYYTSYMIINLFLIFRWKKENRKKSSQAKVLIVAFIATLTLGLIFDFILDAISDSAIPSLGPMLSLMPMGAIFYLTCKNRLMRSKDDSDWDQILNKESRKRLHLATAFLFFGGATINFLQFLLPQFMHNEESIFSIVFTSAAFSIMGSGILLAQLIKNLMIRDILVLTIAVLIIPVVTLAYVHVGSVTIWIVVIILIMLALMFDTKIPLTTIMIIGIITQVIVWIKSPKEPIQMDEIDFLLRIIIILIAYGIGISLHNLYLKRIKEGIYQTKYQKLISDISFMFININKTNYEHKLKALLGQISSFLGANNSYIFTFNSKDYTVDYFLKWGKEGEISNGKGDLQTIRYKACTWWLRELENGSNIKVEDIEALTSAQIDELGNFNISNFQSLIAAPIKERTSLIGFIACDSSVDAKVWKDVEIELLQIISNMVSAMLVKLRIETEMEYLAYFDQLTKIPNRTMFYEHLNQAIKNSAERDEQIGVMLIDLDDFKKVNDTMGHSVGDMLLKNVAEKLKSSLRQSDIVARFGGDEFLLLLQGIRSERDIVRISEKIMKIFEEEIILEGENVSITASGGLAVYPIHGEDGETLIKNADIAMYISKEEGKNRYTIYE